jgi:RND family efflux transporter MFP subunit
LAAANLQAVDAETQLARQTEQRFRTLREAGHTSAQLYDEQRLALRAKIAQRDVARANLNSAKAGQRAAEIIIEEAHVYAPFDGTIQARHVDEGSQTTPGAPIVRLVETAHSEAHIGVPQTVAPTLSAESSFEILWQNRAHPARLTAVLPEIDPDSRTITAVLSIDAAPIPLGAVVELRLSQSVSTPGFWVPITALTESDRGLWGVYVVNDQSRVERRLVEIIHTESERAYVRGTLENGDRIVRTGVQRIVPGQQVTPDTAPLQNTAAR